jgi:hypothetical protein
MFVRLCHRLCNNDAEPAVQRSPDMTRLCSSEATHAPIPRSRFYSPKRTPRERGSSEHQVTARHSVGGPIWIVAWLHSPRATAAASRPGSCRSSRSSAGGQGREAPRPREALTPRSSEGSPLAAKRRSGPDRGRRAFLTSVEAPAHLEYPGRGVAMFCQPRRSEPAHAAITGAYAISEYCHYRCVVASLALCSWMTS